MTWVFCDDRRCMFNDDGECNTDKIKLDENGVCVGNLGAYERAKRDAESKSKEAAR